MTDDTPSWVKDLQQADPPVPAPKNAEKKQPPHAESEDAGAPSGTRDRVDAPINGRAPGTAHGLAAFTDRAVDKTTSELDESEDVDKSDVLGPDPEWGIASIPLHAVTPEFVLGDYADATQRIRITVMAGNDLLITQEVRDSVQKPWKQAPKNARVQLRGVDSIMLNTLDSVLHSVREMRRTYSSD